MSNVYNLCKDSRILRSVGEYQNFRNYFKNYAREKSCIEITPTSRAFKDRCSLRFWAGLANDLHPC